jgi:hypothetical protein
VGRAANDANFADAAFEGTLGSFQFENHAAGNDAALNEALDLLASDCGKDSFAIENAGDVGEIDQLVSAEKFGTSSGHVIGVDVIKLVIGAETEAGSDGNEAFAPEGFDESAVQPSEITNESEAAGDFAVGHRLRQETLSIGGGNANRRIAFGGDGGCEALIQKACEDHHSGIASLTIGDAEAGDKLALDAHALQSFGKGTTAAMHHKDFVTFEGESGDLTSQRAHGGFVFEQCSSELDDSFH